jgi:urease accessory protein
MKRLTGILIMAATPADAHGALPGGGGFYSGAAHPFVSPDHLVALIAVGLLLSQRDLRVGLAVLVMAVMAGLALPIAGVTFAAAALPMLAMAAIVGASVALSRRLPVWAALALSLACGLCIGLQTDVPMDTALIAATAGAGVVMSVFLIAAYVMAVGGLVRSRLQGIPLRVAGSWVLAISLIMLAFLLRDMRGVTA